MFTAAAIGCIMLLPACSDESAAPQESIAEIPSPSPSISEPTALEVFAELRNRADEVYAERDFEAMRGVYDPAGPTWKRVMKDLKIMRREDVVLIRDDEILRRRVVSESDLRFVVREVLISDGRFIHSSGKNFTGDRDPQRQVVRWILIQKNGQFRIHDSVIQSTEDADT